MWRLLLGLLIVGCASTQLGAQPIGASSVPIDQRAAYVRDFAAVEPADLEARIQRYALTDIILYGIGPQLANDPAGLARAIGALRARGVRILAPVANLTRLRALVAFCRETGVRFDGLVTEHEFWNRSDRAVAFREIEGLLVAMRAQIFAWGAPGARIGAYLGYPTAAEATRLATLVHFVFANYAVKDPERAYRHIHKGVPLRDRLARFVKARVAVWPIFYASGEVDMRGALAARGLTTSEASFRAAQAADLELRDEPVAGFVYFTIESMP